MIENRTTLSKKDFQSIASLRAFSARSLFLSILFFAAGCYILSIMGKYAIQFFQGAEFDSLKTAVTVFVSCAAGIIFIIYAFLHNRVVANASYKRNIAALERIYQFTNEGVNVSVLAGGIDQKSLFKYSSMLEFFEKNDSIYIKVLFGKQKMYLIMHNNGYIAGAKNDAIAVLEANGVKRK